MDFYPETFGALGDGRTDDGRALQEAINACCACGGGRVILRSGRIYLSHSLMLRSRVELHLENGSTLRASGELESYFRPDQPERDGNASKVGTPVTGKPSYVFLYGLGCHHLCVSGQGTIDGNGYAFVRRVSPYYVTGDFYPRPTLCYLENCQHVTVRDVTMCRVPFWTLHLGGCRDVLLDSLRILNPLDVANSDGIDVDHSQYVRIRSCHVECADDCICMKNTLGNHEYEPTSHVIVEGCTLISTSAALKIGTEGVDEFSNITFAHCMIDRSNRGISIQVRDAGQVRNVHFQDIMIRTRRFAENWWGCGEAIAVTAFDRDGSVPGGGIEHILFRDIVCEGENGVFLAGMPGRIRDVRMEGVRVRLERTSRWPLDRYDLRPGAGTGIMERKTVPFLSMGADVRLLDVILEDENGRMCRPVMEAESPTLNL